MNPSKLLEFLLPQANFLQIFFSASMSIVVCYTVISTYLAARPMFWERNWNRGTLNNPSGNLDIEHGSVTDLWHAVATVPEKLSEIMPGILLVFGLLGTFIGLGMALDEASHLLQPNALTASGAANSMNKLLGMLDGLGTKFKTSTWGIMGFILLKMWSEGTRFDEKRLAWVIGKVKTELERRKQAQSVTETAKQVALFAQIDGGAQKIVKGFSEQVAQLMERDKVLHQHTLHYLDKVVKAVREDIGQVNAETRAMNTAMTHFTESTQGIVENMATAAQRMAGGADKVGNAADNLVNAVDAFESKFTDVLNNVRKDLGKAINDMSTQASETLERGSKQLGDATREISKALGVLSEDVKGTMSEVKNSITKALEIQQRAANEFTISSNNLNENIAATTGMVDKLGKPIEDGLRSVSASSEHMRGIGKTLEKSIKIMEDVVVRLIELPAALEPLKTLANKQQAMIAVLEHLDAALPTQQQAILKELHGLREDMKSRTTATENVNSNLVVKVDEHHER